MKYSKPEMLYQTDAAEAICSNEKSQNVADSDPGGGILGTVGAYEADE